MAAASGMTGYPEGALSALKARGCPAFKAGGRVHVDALEEWIEEQGIDVATLSGMTELEATNLEIARERLRKIRFDNDVNEGAYMPRADIAGRALELGLQLKAVLRKKLEDEAPVRQEGRKRDEIRQINKQIVDEICEQMQRTAKEWTK